MLVCLDWGLKLSGSDIATSFDRWGVCRPTLLPASRCQAAATWAAGGLWARLRRQFLPPMTPRPTCYSTSSHPLPTSPSQPTHHCPSSPNYALPPRYDLGLPAPLLAACAVCRSGVKRAHLVDARMDGGLLLELYSRWEQGP